MAKAGVGKWVAFDNRKRPHSALGGKSPAVVCWLRKDETQADQQEHRAARTSIGATVSWRLKDRACQESTDRRGSV